MFHIFHKVIHVRQITMLTFVIAKIYKMYFSANKNVYFDTDPFPMITDPNPR